MPQHNWWLRELFEQTLEGMAHARADGCIMDANPALCSMLGYRREELLERRLNEIAHPDSLPAVRAELDRLLGAGGHASPLAVRLVRKDGSEFAASLTLAALRGQDGVVQGIAVVAREISESAQGPLVGAVAIRRDVTEQRTLEQRTQEALDALLAMAGALVAGGEPEPREEQLSASSGAVARRLAELTQSVLGCRRVAIVALDPETEVQRPVAVTGLAPEEEQRWWAEQRQEVRLGNSPYPDVVQRLRAGEVVLIDIARPPFDALPNRYNIRVLLTAPMRVRDQLVGLLTLDHGGAEHDYTPGEVALAGAIAKLAGLVIERERLLREREEARGREVALQEANRRMNAFLSIATHELKTPLAVIKTNVQLAQRILATRWPDESRQDAAASLAQASEAAQSTRRVLERSNQGMRRLESLVDELLDVSRIREGRLDFHLALCDLAAIVREAVDQQRQAHTERVIRLNAPAGPVPLIADGERIGAVVTNYLTNALKYSLPDRPVDVRLHVQGGTARVQVRDEGRGLQPSECERVWDIFYRAPSVDVQTGSAIGMGLGLHISRTIVERHGGQVGVESAPDEGATFWFTLPLA
jgi:PAS domain S-box-containing protein